MNPLEEKIKKISEKMQLLLKQHHGLIKENDRLQKEILDLRRLQEEKARQIDQLDQKLAVLRTATGKLDDSDKKELEKRLSHYIREIDRCMALLGGE
jgi:FtsZ-binding cell division protein ZapB